ncbi:MAG: type II 3-dehydroquinate dehydratase [Pseudomonadales bacterium]|jgi:3-dehydroquinate dehydratase-2|nr:type II 3-dehydroquinate dehydratase [Pseudomonadales bacterium]MDG1937308.1 type II 3-dehydroquinate dehydratase [Pseudomonadales bacterium]MDG2036038.1 type II 3-dehydroquinate dehydratase [Pseudomonadales bacterium]
MPTILVLNGPNLNLLGTREPEQYGTDTLDDIHQRLVAIGQEHGCQIDTMQSNAEVELVERIHQARENTDFIIINPAALTHTSVALRDALLGVEIPFIEVHLSNIYSRETFRHTSFLSDVAVGVISGLGAKSYELALSAAINQLKVD